MEKYEGKIEEIKNTDFSIICNNCIGGFIYQHYNLEYRTPTLGLFIVAKDYIKFLSNIKFYLSQKLEFIAPEESFHYEEFKDFAKFMKFPIAKLYDINIFFLHYNDKEEAQEKWYRRIKKINWNNLMVVMGENETCDYDVVKQFDSLPFENKVCFTKNNYPGVKSVCCIDEMRNEGAQWNAEFIMNHFELTNFINNMIISNK